MDAPAASPEEAVALLRRLVEAPSVNPPGDTTAPAAVARGWLEAQGLPVEAIAARPDKPNLVAQLPNGPGPHLVLLAHLDTVAPGDEAAWTVPPLALTERGGRLLGLGVGNMKAAAAAMMLALRDLARDRGAWAGTVTLALVADECVFGPDGAAHLLAVRPDLAGDLCLCGEGPGGMGLAVAEKGLLWVRLSASGPVGQGMLARPGGTATSRLAAALTALDVLGDERIAPPVPSLDHPGNAEGMRPSLNVGRIGGGTFVSQAASGAWAEIDIRLPPGLGLEAVAARLDSACAAPGLSWERIKGWEPSWSDPEGVLARTVREAAGAVRGTVPADVTRLPASDAARWRARAVPAVCYGPQGALASGPDDHVERRDFLDSAHVYALAARRLLARAS